MKLTKSISGVRFLLSLTFEKANGPVVKLQEMSRAETTRGLRGLEVPLLPPPTLPSTSLLPTFLLTFLFCGPPSDEESALVGAKQAAPSGVLRTYTAAAWRSEEAAFTDSTPSRPKWAAQGPLLHFERKRALGPPLFFHERAANGGNMREPFFVTGTRPRARSKFAKMHASKNTHGWSIPMCFTCVLHFPTFMFLTTKRRRAPRKGTHVWKPMFRSGVPPCA